MKLLQQLRDLSDKAEAAELEAIALRSDLDIAVMSAISMGTDEEDVRAAAGISIARLAAIKGPDYDKNREYHFRGSSDSETFDEVYQARIDHFREIEEIDWTRYTVGETVRIVVQRSPEVLPVDLLYIPRDDDRLLVGFHGAEDRRTLKLPKFQFVRSFMQRPESLLFVSDSTLLNGPKINIGWLAGNKDHHVGASVTEAVNSLVDANSYAETVLVGHSAGGFSAVLVGSQVPNSRAISINGQTVATEYEPWTVRNLHDEAFPETANVEEMGTRYADRLDLRRVLSTRLDSSSFTHFGNRTDQASFGRLPHFPILATHFGLGEEGGITDHGDALVACEWESDNASGHALPGTIMPFVNLVLGEPTSLKIDMSISPVWNR